MAEETKNEEAGVASAGDGEKDAELARMYAEQERLTAERDAYAQQAQELLSGGEDVESAVARLEAERAEQEQRLKMQEERISGLERDLQGQRRLQARAEIERDYPELAGHMELIPDEEPEKMKERAEKLKGFAISSVEKGREAHEKEIAARFGVALGSSAEGRIPPEKREAREKAVGSGDAETVAAQIVEENLEGII